MTTRFEIDHQYTDEQGVTFYGLTDKVRGTRYEATALGGALIGFNLVTAARGWTQRFDVRSSDKRYIAAAADLDLFPGNDVNLM